MNSERIFIVRVDGKVCGWTTDAKEAARVANELAEKAKHEEAWSGYRIKTKLDAVATEYDFTND